MILCLVADSDTIVVIHEGSVKEVDTPFNLLNDEKSIFKSLAEESSEFDEIFRIAQLSSMSKRDNLEELGLVPISKELDNFIVELRSLGVDV